MLEKELIVISLGGSMLFNENQVNAEYVKKVSEIISRARKNGKKIIVVVGGGKTAREYCNASRELRKNEFLADRIGIMATRLNAMLLITALGKEAFPEVISEPWKAIQALNEGLVPVSGGILEGMTTDSVAVLLAEYCGAKEVINVSNVGFLYSEDPSKNPGAKKFEEMTHQELVELASRLDERKARTNFPFDLVACKLSQRSNIEIRFVDGKKITELEKAILGKKHEGTIVRD